MINTTLLQDRITGYWERCKGGNKQPTFKGLAAEIGISVKTLRNVIQGSFNGHPYTNHPHTTRCINNPDFDLVRAMFEDGTGAKSCKFGNI